MKKEMHEFVRARIKAGFKTQGELAKALGINESQVNRMENGAVKTTPRAYTVYKLAGLLKTSERVILKWFL
ncbi:hypothetical protein LCGC14_1269330 [marine sediment metagenome]|uniref:HTH cro/C1-type domain-containing protein n=1 Tax=marine sediment metagenome TaxID=412755 RepID=A0A0F9KYJ8_9ZZZZ|nr:XRE family transcriptional regulator [bacterium]